MKRRTFLTIVGSAAGGVTLGSVGLGKLLPPRQDPSDPRAGGFGLADEREVTGICDGCSAGCTLRLRLVDSRWVGVRPNPYCPIARGGLCARGVSEVEAFYDPDRLLGPVRRSGERGAGRFERITWKQGLEDLRQRVRGLVEGGHGDRIGLLLSSPRGATEATARVVLASLGSPHVYRVDHLRDEAAASLAWLVSGRADPVAYDLERSDMIVSFGTPVLEGWLSPSHVAHTFGVGRRHRSGGFHLVQIESRCSPTAMRADRWVRCKPGTEPVLALGIAAELVREDLVDSGARSGLVGFDPWTDGSGVHHPGFVRQLSYAYGRREVSEQTGVPVEEILRLARDLANADRPVVLGERIGSSHGLFGLAGVQLLNALVGAVGVPGGVVTPTSPPVAPLVTDREGDEARRLPPRLDAPPATTMGGTPIWRVLAEMEREGRDPPFDVLMIEDGAALADVVPADPAFRMLQRIPFVVAFSVGLDAATDVADVVLPSTTSYEQDSDVEAGWPLGFAALAAARPALPRLVDGRPVGDVLLGIGRELGGRMAPAANDMAEVVRHRIGGLFRAHRGAPYSTEFRREWLAQMERGGWWEAPAPDEATFRAAVFERGGWVDPVIAYEAPGANAPYRVHGLARRKVATGGMFALENSDDLWLPRAESSVNGSEPMEGFALIPFAVGVLNGRGTPNRPSLLQIAGPHVFGAFRPWVELNPEDLARLGVKEGQAVLLRTRFGQIRAHTRSYAGIPAGSVGVPSGLGGHGQGRYAKTWALAAGVLLSGARGDGIGARLFRGVRVYVEPAGKGGA